MSDSPILQLRAESLQMVLHVLINVMELKAIVNAAVTWGSQGSLSVGETSCCRQFLDIDLYDSQQSGMIIIR